MTSIEIAGTMLELLPERAVFWPERKTLLVADPHFGKAAAFRAGGIPVPVGTTSEILARLSRIIEKWSPERIVFLGDFLHARAGRSPQMLSAVSEWQRKHSGIELVLVRGNHDRSAGDPPPELRIRCCDAPMIDQPFALLHHPVDVTGHYSLAGHVHPGALLAGAGRQYERLPCFWFGKTGAVLPAFGEFTGLALIEPVVGDRVFVVVEEAVVEVSD
jgi:uncharacterized protein